MKKQATKAEKEDKKVLTVDSSDILDPVGYSLLMKICTRVCACMLSAYLVCA